MKLGAFVAAALLCSACSPATTPTASVSRPPAPAAVAKDREAKAAAIPAKPKYVLSKAQAEARLVAGAVVFDARTAEEYAMGHVNNSINVPVALLEPTLPALDSYKHQEILVVGKDHQQVESMRNALRKAGFTNVLNAASLNS